MYACGSKGIGEVVPVLNQLPRHENVWVSASIAPRILNLGTRWRGAFSFSTRPLYLQGKSPWYPLARRLVEPQGRPGCCGEEKRSCTCQESNLGRL